MSVFNSSNFNKNHLKFVAMLITKLAFSKYKISNFAIFLYNLLPFVCEIIFFYFFIYVLYLFLIVSHSYS